MAGPLAPLFARRAALLRELADTEEQLGGALTGAPRGKDPAEVSAEEAAPPSESPGADPAEPSAEPKTRRSDAISFELDDFDRAIVDELVPNSHDPSKWAAFHAIKHANRAWKLREIDPAMAALRAITAEEEAATALFKSLRRLGYPGAEKLKPRDHLHKNAAAPFVQAVSKQLWDGLGKRFPGGCALAIDSSGEKPRVVIKYVDDKGEYEPVPPLNLRFTEGPIRSDGTIDPATEKPVDFGKAIAERAEAEGAASVKAYLKQRANLRNQILYAADNGIPEVPTPIDGQLRLLRHNTFLLLKIFLLVDGYEEQQIFARQCLLAFLRVVGDTSVEVTFD